jgi:hypothetical protein
LVCPCVHRLPGELAAVVRAEWTVNPGRVQHWVLIRWSNPGGGYADAGTRPERRPSGRNNAGRRKPSRWPKYSGGEAVNPRRMGTESPFKQSLFPSSDSTVVNHPWARHSWISHFT